MPNRVGPKATCAAVSLARAQRRALTPPEFKLWLVLSKRPGGFRFRRQHPLGDNLSLDFFCHAARLAIEVDGEARNRGNRPERDERRDALLARFGIETLRIPAQEVICNLEGVVIAIIERAGARSPHHHRPKGAGGPPPLAS